MIALTAIFGYIPTQENIDKEYHGLAADRPKNPYKILLTIEGFVSFIILAIMFAKSPKEKDRENYETIQKDDINKVYGTITHNI